MQLILKGTIAKDPRFKTERKDYGGGVETLVHKFLEHQVYQRPGDVYVGHANILDNFYDTSMPPEFSDYVCGAEMHEEFNCLSVRHQGHYKLDDGKAEGYLERNYVKSDDYGPADKDEDFPLDGDPEIVRVARLQYHVRIRAVDPRDAVRLYRAIRAGTARPAEDWDAPMVDKP